MKFLSTITALLATALAPAVTAAPTADTASASSVNLQYEYIIVGSGAGGGPLACRLAMAGKKVLLIEAGNDQNGNVNVSVPGYQAVVTQDPKLRWDIFVNHYQDLNRAKRDPKFTYEIAPYQYHVGPNPPAGAKPLGILYPRAGVLGGCVTHNALVWITAHASDWNNIASITGDPTWLAANMAQYLNRVYTWLPTEPTDPTILLRDLTLAQHLVGGAAVQGVGPDPANALTGLAGTLAVDPNSQTNPIRDSQEGFYQIPLIMQNGSRTAVREYIQRTVAAGFPLTVRQNCHVTKILFDKTSPTPKAIGVEFLDGQYLYKASPLSGGKGTYGNATATKETIISGGAYNTVQLLKLSGIGPAAELKSFGIPVVKNLPGVGVNMQDRYEVPVTVKHPKNFSILEGCFFDLKSHDLCLKQWQNNPYVLAQRGAYATDGLAAAMAINSKFADNTDIDLYVFGGPINFVGYFPHWGDYAVADHQHFAWYSLKAHARNRAGTVKLRSTDPLEQPQIDFNYFDTGTTTNGADVKDVSTLVQAVNMSRQALAEYYKYAFLGGDNFTEELPGSQVQSEADIEQYVKDHAWGHHASCTAAIGADNDPYAVLDSQFRVRGVQNLRVVDASVFPRIPGIFIQAPIFVISEKAADAILSSASIFNGTTF